MLAVADDGCGSGCGCGCCVQCLLTNWQWQLAVADGSSGINDLLTKNQQKINNSYQNF
jgi:hypothetical protein